LEKAIELKTDYFEAQLNLGTAYYETDRIDEALSVFQKALESNEHSIVYFNLGLCL
jgi:tetratricopeptide (TPR) repeat protein